MIIKNIFRVLAFIGVLVISILSFILSKDPYMIIPSYTMIGFDKLLWLCYIVGGSFIYLLLLYFIYDKVRTEV